MANEAEFSATIIKAIHDAMMSRVRMASVQALMMAERSLRPIPLIIGGGALLAAAYAI
jgi:hypothetical protein